VAGIPASEARERDSTTSAGLMDSLPVRCAAAGDDTGASISRKSHQVRLTSSFRHGREEVSPRAFDFFAG
jgi:hypothetical protein